MASKRVVWDESNLDSNEEYRRTHPVTMCINEPKTPYEPFKDMDAEGNFINSEDEIEKKRKNPREYEYHEHQDADDEDHWDEQTKAFARRARVTAPHVVPEMTASDSTVQNSANSSRGIATNTTATTTASGRVRPTLGISALNKDQDEEELCKKQHETEFRYMRKAVYADEGAKFKAMLAKAKQHNEEDE